MLSACAGLCCLIWLVSGGFPLGAAAQQPAGNDPVGILKREGQTVREKTNQNDHPRITLYNTSYHKLAKNSPYCGTSVEWAIKQAGWELLIDYAPIARNWSLNKSLIVWTHSSGPMVRSGKRLVPQRNDVVVFCTNVKGKIRWHVGLLEDWQEGNNYCKTVEGNTSDRGVANLKKPTGQEGVYDEKIRSKNGIFCVVRPYRT